MGRFEHRVGVAVVLAFWFVACGGSTPTGPSNPPIVQPANRAPVITTVSVTPAVGVADLQPFRFFVMASDPDGDALSYLWDVGYGTGSTNTAASFTATYGGGSGGPVTITVRVSDGKGGTADGSASIMLGSMSGLWTLSDGGGELRGMQFGLVQSSVGAVTGNYRFPGGGSDVIPADQPGQITVGGEVMFPVRVGSRAVVFRGLMDLSTGRRITGTLDGGGFSGVSFVLDKS